MFSRSLSALALLPCFVGCAHHEPPLEVACHTVPILKPIPVKALPDKSLLAPLPTPAVVWTDPADVRSSSCLTADGEQAYLDLLDACVTRQHAWRAWAVEPLPQHGSQP